jgi:hypothetical protein
MKLFKVMLLLPALAYAQVEITGGRIYLEEAGGLSTNYYSQVYKAQEAAINRSIECQCTIKIKFPDQTVRYVPVVPPVVPPTSSVIQLDNEAAGTVGTWQQSSTPGTLGAPAIFSNDDNAEYLYTIPVAVGKTYNIEVHTTQYSTRTELAVYSINGSISTLNQRQSPTGWASLTTTTALSDSIIISVTKGSTGSLLIDDIRVTEVSTRPTVLVSLNWEYPTVRANGDALAVTEIDHIEAEVANVTLGTSEIYSTAGIAKSYITPLIVANSYRFRVRAVLKDGQIGAWSEYTDIGEI